MSELDTPAPSKAEIKELLNPDFMSGKQIEVMKKIDESNVDRSDLEDLLEGLLASYLSAKNGV